MGSAARALERRRKSPAAFSEPSPLYKQTLTAALIEKEENKTFVSK
jgi:hypothetical protein